MIADRGTAPTPKGQEAELERARHELVDASRRASMAEVATGVLHNVGNVLNSVNVSASVLASGLRQSKVESLGRISDLLREHSANLGGFLGEDPKGRLIPAFIESLARNLSEDRRRLLKEIEALQLNLDHIKEIVSLQQSYATMVSSLETLDAAQLVEDSLRLNAGALTRHEVTVVRDFHPVPRIVAEKGKVLQILVNLIRNAKHACDDGPPADQVGKRIVLHIGPGTSGFVRLSVLDNGIGIARENLGRIFTHGFTTRATGHGFGLHSSAVAAGEMRGTLAAASEGLGRGAVFTLELPADPSPGSP